MYSYTGAGGGPGGGLDDHELRIGGWGDTYHALVAFDLTGLPEVVSQATLELYVAQSASPPSFRVDVVTAPWDWRTQGTGSDRERLWWADHPSYSAYSGSIGPAALGSWDQVDITALYNAWQDGSVPNHGVVLRPEATWNNWQFWASSATELGNELRPRIVVVP